MRAREPVTKTQKHVYIAEIDILIHAPRGWWGKDSKTMFLGFFDTWHTKSTINIVCIYLPIILKQKACQSFLQSLQCDFCSHGHWWNHIMSHRIKQVPFPWLLVNYFTAWNHRLYWNIYILFLYRVFVLFTFFFI